MQQVHSVSHCNTIVTVDPSNQVLYDHSIIINDGLIKDILPIHSAQDQYSGQIENDYDHHIIIPGLINAHTHSPMTLFRGIASDLHLMDWLNNHIWPAEQKWVDEEFVEVGTQLAIAEMIRGGVTCFNDMYFYAEATARQSAKASMRCMAGMILLDFPTKYASSVDEYFSKGLEMHDQYSSHPLVRCAFAPHAPYTVSNPPLERVAILANELDVPVHIHLHETKDEINNSLEHYKARPIQRFSTLGLLNSNLIAVHMTQLEEKEIDLIAENKVNVVHCPESNLKLASGFCPTTDLLAKNINVCIGTDSCASNDDLDILGEMRMASLLAKGISKNASSFITEEILRSATINAAQALGIDNETGSIEKGKSADFTVINIDTLESLPIYNSVSQLVYATSRSQVQDVWIAGKQLLQNRQLTTIDEEELISKVKHWNNKIAETNG